MPPPIYFPLRWESTGDQWWYASPIDYAAANGLYDLVRELLRLDGNHLIKLTSLRRIRRLETVWDDEEQFHDVATCRSSVARQLLSECEVKQGRNSLIGAGYGGWVLYTAASAGDLGFVKELLEKDPLLVFGEGEYGVTDILYAAARGKDPEVFKVVLDYVILPRLLGGGEEEDVGEIPSAYKLEIMNRALHASARGGNVQLVKEILGDCCDSPLAYRDRQGATVLHAAAARGKVEVVKYLVSYSELIHSTDNRGNTPLHVAAHRGHLPVVEALILASPSSVNTKNNSGETFLHTIITGFQTPGFRRIDHQIELMKHIFSGNLFNIKEIINAKTNNGRTALHLAIIENVHSDLVELLMTARSIDVNVRDSDGLTPLDILRQHPCSSSDRLTMQLISAGGILSTQDYSARKVIASHIKRQSLGGSPGTSFRINDMEIFLHTGMENASDGIRPSGVRVLSPELSRHGSTTARSPVKLRRSSSMIKRLLNWPKTKTGTSDRLKKLVDDTFSEEVPVPLRERFSKPSTPSNKRVLAVRSNQPSPIAKRRLVPGHTNPHRSRSSSFSKFSLSSQSSLDAQNGHQIENEISKAETSANGSTRNSVRGHGFRNKRLMNHYLCFGGPSQCIGSPRSGLEPYEVYERSVLSAA